MAFRKVQKKNTLNVKAAYDGTSLDPVFSTSTAKLAVSATVANMETVGRAIANLQKYQAGMTPANADLSINKRYIMHND